MYGLHRREGKFKWHSNCKFIFISTKNVDKKKFHLFFYNQQKFRKYIEDVEGCDDLFIEEQETGLAPSSQQIVYKLIFEFIKDQYSLFAKPTEIENVCMAAIELFPSIKANGSEIGGIVSFNIICVCV